MARIFGNSAADMTKPLNGAFVMYGSHRHPGTTAKRAAAGFISLGCFFPYRRHGYPPSREEPLFTYTHRQYYGNPVVFKYGNSVLTPGTYHATS